MKSLKTRKTATWLTATTSEDAGLLDLLIYTRYGERRLNSVGQLLETSVNQVADMEFLLHGVEWDRLWASYVAEYNPIWNVDGTISETETRDLEANHTGTDTIAKSGTDALAKTGTDTLGKSGSDTYARTGTDALAKTGTVADAKSGYDSLAKTGTETLGKDGTETVTQTGTDTVRNIGTTTVQNNINAYESVTSVPTNDSVTTPDLTNTNTKNLTDTKTLDTTDTTTHNTTDTQNYNSTDTVTHNTTDTRTLNTLDTQSYGETDTRTLNTTDTQTYNSSNTDTKNLKDTDEGTITRVTERTGNIGVTKTQELLESDRDYWLNLKSLFYENVITDIINDICYKIHVDI